MKNFYILNGPNLNLLGLRQVNIYGEMSLEELIVNLKSEFSEHKLGHFQSNHEGDLIDYLHKYGFNCDGIVLNAGAFSHTSIAIADAIRSISVPVVEVHISKIEEREDYRKHSYLKEVCVQSISGKGTDGYSMAIRYLLENQ